VSIEELLKPCEIDNYATKVEENNAVHVSHGSRTRRSILRNDNPTCRTMAALQGGPTAVPRNRALNRRLVAIGACLRVGMRGAPDPYSSRATRRADLASDARNRSRVFAQCDTFVFTAPGAPTDGCLSR
jgi:hypothetical protein